MIKLQYGSSQSCLVWPFLVWRRGSKLGLTSILICLLLGCDIESSIATTAVAASSIVPTLEIVEVAEQPVRSVTIGSIGGSLRLTDRIAAVYSVALRDGGAWLEGVALLRGKQQKWYTRNLNAVPNTMENVGIGSSVGPHMVVVTPKADGVWIDDRLFAPLQAANVVLIDGAGEDPAVIATTTIEAYLGPTPLDQAGDADDAVLRKALVQDRLRAILSNSDDIQDQWPSS